MLNGTQLSWDDTVALVQLLRENHHDVPLENISLGDIYQWVIELPQFCDDPKLANDDILLSILTEWIEEV
jgi:FeS assembly protein IscX